MQMVNETAIFAFTLNVYQFSTVFSCLVFVVTFAMFWYFLQFLIGFPDGDNDKERKIHPAVS